MEKPLHYFFFLDLAKYSILHSGLFPCLCVVSDEIISVRFTLDKSQADSQST